MLWEYQIWLEMWLGGMAGGAYLAAFLFEHASGQNTKQLLRPATFLVIPLVLLALILSLIDLGEPLRFWHMLVSIKPLSPMWLGAFLLQPFVGIAVIMAILWIVESRKASEEAEGLRKVNNILSWINVFFAGSLIAYSGVLLAASNVPLWAGTPLLPALFVVSAAATGVAILVFSALIYRGVWKISGDTIKQLAGSLPAILIIQLVLLAGFIVMAGSSSVEGSGEAVKVLTGGSLMIPFWMTLAAFVVSIVLIFVARGKEIEQGARGSLVTASLLVIVAGLIMRAVIIIGGQT